MGMYLKLNKSVNLESSVDCFVYAFDFGAKKKQNLCSRLNESIMSLMSDIRSLN